MQYLAHDRYSIAPSVRIDAADPVAAALAFVQGSNWGIGATVNVHALDHVVTTPVVRVHVTVGVFPTAPWHETCTIHVVVSPV